MKKNILFLALIYMGTISATHETVSAAQPDVQYIPEGQESYYHTNAPWYGTTHSRQGYHRTYTSSPYKGSSLQESVRTSKLNPRNWNRSGRWGKGQKTQSYSYTYSQPTTAYNY